MGDDIVTAEVRPLDGKHYGTKIIVRHPSGRKFDIDICMPIGSPSDEELAEFGIDRSMWESNVEVPDGWGGTEPVQSVFPSDNHYQSLFEEAIARRISEALNGMVWDG